MHYLEEIVKTRSNILNCSGSSSFYFFNLEVSVIGRHICCHHKRQRELPKEICREFPGLGQEFVQDNADVFKRFGLSRLDAVIKMIEIAHKVLPEKMVAFNIDKALGENFHEGSFPDEILTGNLTLAENRFVLRQFLFYLTDLVEKRLTKMEEIVFNKKTVVIL